ncbi:MAG: hypothetical protein LBV17_02070 [Treponema sp.]|jgi:hypothetical protein|nr:hypothetical protein [Treponema sp.]
MKNTIKSSSNQTGWKRYASILLFIFLLAITVVSFSTCDEDIGEVKDEDTKGELTINGFDINTSSYFAYALGNTGENDQLGAYTDFKTKKLGRINSNGSVTLSVWKIKDSAGLNYKGNDYVVLGVWVYDNYNSLHDTGTVEVTFTNGVGTGTVSLSNSYY